MGLVIVSCWLVTAWCFGGLGGFCGTGGFVS